MVEILKIMQLFLCLTNMFQRYTLHCQRDGYER